MKIDEHLIPCEECEKTSCEGCLSRVSTYDFSWYKYNRQSHETKSTGGDSMSPELVNETKTGKYVISAAALYDTIGRQRSGYSRWLKKYVTGCRTARENIDYKIMPSLRSGGRPRQEIWLSRNLADYITSKCTEDSDSANKITGDISNSIVKMRVDLKQLSVSKQEEQAKEDEKVNDINIPDENTQLVTIHNNIPMATSVQVAEYFGDEHKNVLRDIRNILQDVGEAKYGSQEGLLRFEPSSYMSEQNKEQPMYLLNKNAFMLVVMNKAGGKATKLKLIYMEQFDRMRKALQEKEMPSHVEALRGWADTIEINDKQARAITKQNKMLNQQKEQIQEMEPKVDAFRKTADLQDTMSFKDASIQLNRDNEFPKLGRNLLLRYLVYKAILYKPSKDEYHPYKGRELMFPLMDVPRGKDADEAEEKGTGVRKSSRVDVKSIDKFAVILRTTTSTHSNFNDWEKWDRPNRKRGKREDRCHS